MPHLNKRNKNSAFTNIRKCSVGVRFFKFCSSFHELLAGIAKVASHLEHANRDSRRFPEMTFEKNLIRRYAHTKGWRQPTKSCFLVATNHSSPQWIDACYSNELAIVVGDQYPAQVRTDCR